VNTTAPSERWDFEGYIFDIYSVGTQIYIWLINDARNILLVVDEHFPVIYAHGKREILNKLALRLTGMQSLARAPRFESKRLFYPNRLVDALRLEIRDPSLLPGMKRRLFSLYNKFDIYHSDIDPVTGYLSDRGLFPLAPVRVQTHIKDKANRVLRIEGREAQRSLEYHPPALRILQMAMQHSHRLGMGSHNPLILQSGEKKYIVTEKLHQNYIHRINEIIRAENPDCIISSFGDQVIFPFLFATAQEHGLTLELDRDLATAITRTIKRKGTSFNTYGSWIYRAASYPLYGRWHIDQQNSFTFKHTDLAGTIELARISGMGVQRLARASTGNALTEMETDVAIKKGYLVPWQKSALENRKTWYELQLYDKGGLIYQPDIRNGIVRHNVAQLDFSQMYPSIMHIHNISPETINCPCCAGEVDIPRVPETGYHICVKRRGVVSDALEHILERRAYYKRRLQQELTDAERLIYQQRVDSLKWMNVVSFGYLGFRNAKFGKLESHESVTAFGRDKLLTAVRLAEEHGFDLVHAITDCIFIEKQGGLPFEPGEIAALQSAILAETQVEMSCEGIFSWALFLPSRSNRRLPVANRYLGRFDTGKLKLRGLVSRRKDAPEFIRNFQLEILELLTGCIDAAAIRAVYPQARDIYVSAQKKLTSGQVKWELLLLRRTVSHALEDYQVANGTSLTMQELAEQGLEVSPGEKVRFLVVNRKYYEKTARYMSEERAAALGREYLRYDTEYYLLQLYEAFAEVFDPFLPQPIKAPREEASPQMFR
jgi:DNA polymerase elongation subunit (family B)